jgi:hypothetical protein
MALFAGTTLTRIENRSGMTAVVLDLEHPGRIAAIASPSYPAVR